MPGEPAADPTHRVGDIEAGAAGRHLVTVLERDGYNLDHIGHSPDRRTLATIVAASAELLGWNVWKPRAPHQSPPRVSGHGNLDTAALVAPALAGRAPPVTGYVAASRPVP